MTTLDDRLYAWLSQPDDRRFALAFNAYFAVAFPAVIRHLARFAPSDPALLEEIAQDALLRFFERIGRARRAAAQAIDSALRQIRPVALGSFHEHQLRAWTADVGSFRRTTMGFRLSPVESDAALTWKNTIRELTLRIPALQRGGWRLIDGLRIAVQWHAMHGADSLAQPRHVAGACPDSTDSTTCEHVSEAADTDPATADFTCAITRAAPAAGIAEARLPGTLQFVHCAVTIIRSVPGLRIPTNGYLFEISHTLYLDDYRKRRRQRRGGAVTQAHDDVARSDGDGVLHPLEDPRLDADADEAEAAEALALGGSSGAGFTTSGEGVEGDPIRRLEDQQYFEAFYAYLRAPVDAAEAAYDAARAHGVATAERRKWDSLGQKFSRSIAVLAAVGEGYTQEQTAERLRLSRNQVKYVIENLQDAYARFAAHSTGSSRPRTIGGVFAHEKE